MEYRDVLPEGRIKTADERYETAYRWASGLTPAGLADCLRINGRQPRFYSVQQRRALCDVAANYIELWTMESRQA